MLYVVIIPEKENQFLANIEVLHYDLADWIIITLYYLHFYVCIRKVKPDEDRNWTCLSCLYPQTSPRVVHPVMP